MMTLPVLTPNWPAPKNIKVYSTTRLGGVSLAPFDALNLGYSSGDTQEAVTQNRQLLQQTLALPTSPCWRRQAHTNIAIHVSENIEIADACYSDQTNQVCVVQTADCLPVLLCNRAGTEVAAIHAGWRGLANGVIANAVGLFNTPAVQLMAWLGPAISQQHFEVGSEVKQIFLQQQPENELGFIPHPIYSDKYFADLYCLARLQLQRLKINAIYGGDYCTYSDATRFFSYRRDKVTGRMASLIWIAS